MTIISGEIKGIDKAFSEFQKELEIANFRTLNIQANRALKVVLKEIKDETGINQSTIKKAIKVKKATKNTPITVIKMKGSRLGLSKVRQLKKGISFTGRGKKRVKLTNPIEGGSRPFVIKGKNSGKNVAVYRKPGNKRTVTTLRGSSVPFLFGIVGVDEERFQSLIMKGFPDEYLKQIFKARFRGGRKRK